jgi:hypothetical protein
MNEIPISDHIAIYILTWDAQKWASAGSSRCFWQGAPPKNWPLGTKRVSKNVMSSNHIMFGIELKVIERAFM